MRDGRSVSWPHCQECVHDYDHDADASAPPTLDPLKGSWGVAILRRMFGANVCSEVVRLSYVEYFDEKHALDSDALKTLKEFRSLQELSLGEMGERLTDAALARLSPLDHLSTLDLRSSPVTDAGLRHLAPLVRLQSLNLDGCQITGEGLSRLGGCKNLRHLYLRRVQLSVAGMREIERFKSLWSVAFDPPPAGGEEAFRICGQLPQLRILEIDGARLSGGCLRHLANLAELQYVFLERSNIAPDELTALAQLANLRVLDLSETDLTDAVAAELANLTHLEGLFMANTAIGDEALAISQL